MVRKINSFKAGPSIGLEYRWQGGAYCLEKGGGYFATAFTETNGKNLALLDEMFGSSADFYSKEVELYHCRGALVLFDGMASLESLWELLLDAVSRRTPALDETPARECRL